MNNKTLAYVFARLVLGLSMFGHGAIRVPKIGTFSAGIVKQFAESPLPEALILPLSYVIPIAELVLGILLLLGLFTRTALIGTGILLLVLIFGTTMIENWNALVPQMVHSAFVVGLLAFVDDYKSFSIQKRS
ncbi:thiosulfate dehydrogenase [quinone] large subunit [bacterium A37T11]|nr:thiosulfate dehydrogenase [quinone] large subunit [bacterium A37T11]